MTSKKNTNRVIIAGSRTISDYKLVERAIESFDIHIDEVVSGGAYGVDKCGEWYAEHHNIPCKIFPAKWNDLKAPGAIIKSNAKGKYNVKAGFDRNEEMAKYATHLIAIVDPESCSGTNDMIERAKAHNLQVFIWEI